MSGNSRRAPLVRSLTAFWRDDKGLSVFSVALLIVIFVMPPLLADSAGRRLPGDIAFARLLVSGVLALADRGPVRAVLLPFALPGDPARPSRVAGRGSLRERGRDEKGVP